MNIIEFQGAGGATPPLQIERGACITHKTNRETCLRHFSFLISNFSFLIPNSFTKKRIDIPAKYDII